MPDPKTDVVDLLRTARQELHLREIHAMLDWRGENFSRWGSAVGLALVEIELLRAARDAAFNEGVEEAAKVVKKVSSGEAVKAGAVAVVLAIEDRVRSLKRGEKK